MKKIFSILIISFIYCSNQPGPKDTVFNFIRAVYDSDSVSIAEILDVDSYIRKQMVPMSPEDSVTVFEEYRTKTIRSLLGEGPKRAYWLKSQILVNKERVKDDFAEVDVSFIDRDTGVLRYTQIQLERQPDDTWKIVYFQ